MVDAFVIQKILQRRTSRTACHVECHRRTAKLRDYTRDIDAAATGLVSLINSANFANGVNFINFACYINRWIHCQCDDGRNHDGMIISFTASART
jgi:hypothetical protein